MPTSTVTVATAATVVAAENQKRIYLLVWNKHASNTIYLGDDSSVTTGNGIEVVAGDFFVFEHKGGPFQFFHRGDVYGIAGGNTDVNVWEISER